MELQPLNAPLGAVITGINICQSMNSEQTTFIEKALADYGMVVFKEQFISEEDQLLFTKSFGDHKNSNLFSQSKKINAPSREVIHRGENDFVDYWTDGPKFKNLPFSEKHPYWPVNKFHSDLMYRKDPLQYTILGAIEVTKTGGETEFADTAQIFNHLPENLQAELLQLQAYHSAPELDYNELVEHPLVIGHPINGMHGLYLGGLFSRSIENDKDGTLFNMLLEHINNIPQACHKHKWSEGDVIMWDNLRVLHRRCPFLKDEPRVLRRTQCKRIVPEPSKLAAEVLV